jgi:hypothetical protein
MVLFICGLVRPDTVGAGVQIPSCLPGKSGGCGIRRNPFFVHVNIIFYLHFFMLLVIKIEFLGPVVHSKHRFFSEQEKRDSLFHYIGLLKETMRPLKNVSL